MAGQTVQFDMPVGAEPLDAYRALQLMPSAPHDLVEQAYWVLVSRARSRGSNSSRLGLLNDAYATLINADRRAVYDAEHNLTKLRARPKLEMPKRPMFSRTPKFNTRLTHYQLLDIDFEALPEVVDTAYVFHKAQLRRSDPRTIYLRALFEDAYSTLSNPQTRAAYDEKVAPRHRKTEPAATAAVAQEPPPPAPLFPEPAAEAAVQAPVQEHLAVEATAAPTVAPAPAAVIEPRAPKQPGPLSRWMTSRRQRLEEKSAREPKPAHQPRPSHAIRGDERRDVIAAEQKRLSDLGMLAEPLPEFAPRPLTGRARFRFTDGPQAGQTVGLTENSLILGASEAADVVLDNPDGMIGAGHVRVWRREDEYILHQLDSFSTTYVNGERLDLRLAILERGDEIRIGPHTLIFDELPVEATEPASTVDA